MGKNTDVLLAKEKKYMLKDKMFDPLEILCSLIQIFMDVKIQGDSGQVIFF